MQLPEYKIKPDCFIALLTFSVSPGLDKVLPLQPAKGPYVEWPMSFSPLTTPVSLCLGLSSLETINVHTLPPTCFVTCAFGSLPFVWLTPAHHLRLISVIPLPGNCTLSPTAPQVLLCFHDILCNSLSFKLITILLSNVNFSNSVTVLGILNK